MRIPPRPCALTSLSAVSAHLSNSLRSLAERGYEYAVAAEKH